MFYNRDLIARLFLTDFIDLPLEIARKVISRMTDEDICKDFDMEVIRKGYFVLKINK